MRYFRMSTSFLKRVRDREELPFGAGCVVAGAARCRRRAEKDRKLRSEERLTGYGAEIAYGNVKRFHVYCRRKSSAVCVLIIILHEDEWANSEANDQYSETVTKLWMARLDAGCCANNT